MKNMTDKELISGMLKVDADDLFTAKEAAEYLCIQHGSALKAISRKRLIAHKIGFGYYVTREDIEQYYKETRKQ